MIFLSVCSQGVACFQWTTRSMPAGPLASVVWSWYLLRDSTLKQETLEPWSFYWLQKQYRSNMLLSKSYLVQRTLNFSKHFLRSSPLDVAPVQRLNFDFQRGLSSASNATWRIIRSSLPDMHIPNTTYIEFILEHCERHGKKHAIVSTLLVYHVLIHWYIIGNQKS